MYPISRSLLAGALAFGCLGITQAAKDDSGATFLAQAAGTAGAAVATPSGRAPVAGRANSGTAGGTPMPSAGASPVPSAGSTPVPSANATPAPSAGTAPAPSANSTPVPSAGTAAGNGNAPPSNNNNSGVTAQDPATAGDGRTGQGPPSGPTAGGGTVDDMTSRDMNVPRGPQPRGDGASSAFAAELKGCQALPPGEKSACQSEARRRHGQM